MSKRASILALAAGAVLAAGSYTQTARAADTVPGSPAPAQPAPAAMAPAASDGPTSVINEYIFKPTGLAKPLADAGIKVGGFVEGSYTYNFRDPKSNINEGRVFDFEHDAARLNQVALQVAKSVDVAAAAKAGKFDIGFGVDMLYGSDGRLIHSNGLEGYNRTTHPINQYDLTQAYVDLVLPVGNGLDIKIGKFVTPFGVETIAPVATVTGSSGNAFYSHSFLFGFGIPFTHTGVLATYALNDKLSVYGGFSRGWEQSTKDNNGSIDFLGGGSYVISPELKATVNVSVGPQRARNNKDYREVVEGILAYTPDPKKSPLTLALDVIGGRDEHASVGGRTAYWYGATAYAGYTLSDMITLNGRAEWFRDDGGSRLGLSAHFFEGTVGLSIKPFYKDKIGQNLVIRPEIRGDYCDRNAFDGGTKKSQATVAVDAIFSL